MKKDIIGELSGRHEALAIAAKDFADELTRHNIIE